jgi:hypothetical protein
MKLRKRYLAVAAIAVAAAGVGSAAYAAGSPAAKPASLYGCLTKTHTVAHAYLAAGQGCAKGQSAFTTGITTTVVDGPGTTTPFGAQTEWALRCPVSHPHVIGGGYFDITDVRSSSPALWGTARGEWTVIGDRVSSGAPTVYAVCY